jgi:hypothetical protein
MPNKRRSVEKPDALIQYYMTEAIRRGDQKLIDVLAKRLREETGLTLDVQEAKYLVRHAIALKEIDSLARVLRGKSQGPVSASRGSKPKTSSSHHEGSA